MHLEYILLTTRGSSGVFSILKCCQLTIQGRSTHILTLIPLKPGRPGVPGKPRAPYKDTEHEGLSLMLYTVKE